MRAFALHLQHYGIQHLAPSAADGNGLRNAIWDLLATAIAQMDFFASVEITSSHIRHGHVLVPSPSLASACITECLACGNDALAGVAIKKLLALGDNEEEIERRTTLVLLPIIPTLDEHSSPGTHSQPYPSNH